jgi:hypothetical protein
VDGPNASYITPTALDRWEKRLEDLFEGRPYDMYDAALSDTVSKFPVDIQVNPSVRPSIQSAAGTNLPQDVWKPPATKTSGDLHLLTTFSLLFFSPAVQRHGPRNEAGPVEVEVHDLRRALPLLLLRRRHRRPHDGACHGHRSRLQGLDRERVQCCSGSRHR